MTLPALRPALDTVLVHVAEHRLALIQQVEQAYGRDGVWCGPCRSSTPPAHVAVHRDRLVLRCEQCRRELLVLPRLHQRPWAVRARVRPPARSSAAVRSRRWRR